MAQYPRKLKEGIRYWYKFSYQGKTFHSKCIYHTKIEARKAENKHFDEVSKRARDPDSVQSSITLLEAINARLDYVKTKKSLSYYKDNKRYYKVILEALGNTPIESVKRADIEDLLLETSQELQDLGKDNYVVNAMLAVYKALFNHAISKHDLSIKNPCIGIKQFSVEKRLKYIPKDEDIEAVKKICDKRQRLLIDFIMETGARISEALRFKGKDIIGNEIVLYTRKSKNSNLVPRKLPKPLCLKYIVLKSDEKLFGDWKEQPKFLERKVRQLKQKPWGFHNLRHRYASLLSKHGVPLYDIMSKLGHQNLSTTQIYLQML
ncbi:MAG: site-specific integrase [Ignavibacteriae bacterium]|nr:site-specific integrase [Ignavibacteriota bacterium]